MIFNKKTILFFVLIFCVFNFVSAQKRESFEQFNKRRQEQFDKYKDEKRKKFEEFRRKRNEEFAKFVREDWKSVDPSPVLPRPDEETVPPVVKPEEDVKPTPTPTPLPYEEVVPAPQPKPQPEPIDPIEEEPIIPKTQIVKEFMFFGTVGKVRFDKANTIHLPVVDENAIADAWLKLSEESYTNLIYDCLQIREQYSLCDWTYLVMLQEMAEAVYGKGTNESVLLMAYVYCQSGYKMRMAIGIDNKLYMMFASDHAIYNWNYYDLDGEFYYTYNNRTGKIRICEQQYPQERPMSLLISKQQKLAINLVGASLHQSASNEDVKVSMSANKNMLDFYSSYPTSMIGDNFVSRWAMYANTPMPEYVKEQIYPQLKRAIGGLDQLTAVNSILNWVQTGFTYEYDDEVWGCDRALFPEESLYYPFCDCEDRSILFTRIVRDLLGLKCILIYYPGHLAAAVEITQGNPTGDYIAYDNRRFFIADGTILYGVPVGETMRGMDNQTAKIILLE